MSQRERFLKIRRSAPVILPSLLLCDFANLSDEVRRLRDAQITTLHLDVMDGQFVPNLTYGMPIVESLRRSTDMVLDVHLMIADPASYIERFCESGADAITIHIEATDPVAAKGSPAEQLKRIRDLGVAAGIALNPDTPLEAVESCVGHCDLVLVMSVPAGFGGQKFRPATLERLKQARTMFGSDVILEVDGGVNKDTIMGCSVAGAELFVVGSAIFRQPDYGRAVAELYRLATLS